MALFTRARVAAITGTHINTVYHWIRSGKLKAIQVNRVIRIDAADLAAFLEAHKTGTGK